MVSKICKECHVEKDIDSFYTRKSSIDGHRHICKECSCSHSNKRYLDNRESCIAGFKDNYLLNKEIYKIRNKTWISENYKRVWVSRTLLSHKRKGFIVNISKSELFLHIDNKNVCEICGRSLDWSYGNKGKIQPNSPTLDRINNGKTMTIATTMILCADCNNRKHTTPYKEYIKIRGINV